MLDEKTAIITGASQDIGAGLVEVFLKQGYNVVATPTQGNARIEAQPPSRRGSQS